MNSYSKLENSLFEVLRDTMMISVPEEGKKFETVKEIPTKPCE